jgi:hypothetical protein
VSHFRAYQFVKDRLLAEECLLVAGLRLQVSAGQDLVDKVVGRAVLGEQRQQQHVQLVHATLSRETKEKMGGMNQ